MRESGYRNRGFYASQQWRRELQAVRELRDANGAKVDRDIVRAVAAVRLLGLNTTMSCSGHAYRRTTGPYIVIRSHATTELVAAAEQEEDLAAQQALYRSAQKIAQAEVLPLLAYVNQFNGSPESIAEGSLLELRTAGHSSVRLCFVHADFDGLMDEATHRATLQARRYALSRFVDLLIDDLAGRAA